MDVEGRRLAAVIEARLGSYIPGEPRERLRLEPLDSRIRATTRLDRFAIDRPGGRTRILAKTYLDGGPAEPARPRLAPLVAVPARAALEFRALSAVASDVGRADPARLGAVPVLDLLDERTVLMVELPWTSLDRVLVRRRTLGRFAGPPGAMAIVDAFRNAGHWLARFRALPLATEGVRLGSRDEVLEALSVFGTHLGEGAGPGRDQLGRVLAAAEAVFPTRSPTGPGHGDFAMRNLLVDRTGRVAALDTRARWSVPIEEDLATLLVALRTNRLQSATRGRAWTGSAVVRYEDALLDGAGYDRAARPRLRVVEILVLWDKWSALRARASAGGAGRRSRLVAAIAERHFRATTADLLRTLEQR